jgi:DNA-binding XRE family transcriptional regulator
MTEFEETLKFLKETYKKATMTKKEVAHELNVSESTISNRISKGIDLPNYKKLGKEKSAKVVFPIVEVARYICGTVSVH